MSDPNEGIVLQPYPDTAIRQSLPPLPTRGGSRHVVMPETMVMPTQSELQLQEARAREKRVAKGRDA